MKINGYEIKPKANLHGANLREAHLREANLRGADLREADLRWADLRGVNLREANLRGADLSEAYLSGANLSEAYLSGANLSEAYLRGANLRWANLRWMIGNSKEIKTLQLPEYHVVVTKDQIAIGCQQHKAEDWFEFDDAEISAMDEGALEWWTEWKGFIKQVWAKGAE